MPACPPKPCHHPGCRAFALPGKARCADHAHVYDRTTRATSRELALAAKIRGSQAWKGVRVAFVAENPVCCDPFHQHTTGPEPTQDVHHVEPLHRRPDLAFDTSNLRPLCRQCHNAVEALERRGTCTQHLFGL